MKALTKRALGSGGEPFKEPYEGESADPSLQTIAVGRISIVSCRTDTCLQTVERPVPAEGPCPLVCG